MTWSNWFRKKKEIVRDISGALEGFASVNFGGVKIGDVMAVTAKEIMGKDHMEILIRLDLGSGIEPQIVQVLGKQGLYIGRPLNAS